MNTPDVATPEAFVLTVIVFIPPVKVPLAPVAGAVKVTAMPLSRFPPASFTVAVSGLAKAAPATAVCGVPPVAAMVAGGPTRFDKAKVAGAMPLTAAVTL